MFWKDKLHKASIYFHLKVYNPVNVFDWHIAQNVSAHVQCMMSRIYLLERYMHFCYLFFFIYLEKLANWVDSLMNTLKLRWISERYVEDVSISFDTFWICTAVQRLKSKHILEVFDEGKTES